MTRALPGQVHVIGVGGVGMSVVARLLLARGVVISGSHGRDEPVLEVLREQGATIHAGHLAGNLVAADVVVISTATQPDNPELIAARERGIPVWHRAEALAALMAGYRAVAVAGTHGKTTTTAMLAMALTACGADPSYAVGGDLDGPGSGAHLGSGPDFVAEADESDESFLALTPHLAVITNVESDHLDHYGSAEAVFAAFRSFVRRVPGDGVLVVCADAPAAVDVAASAEAVVRRYGTATDADVRLVDLTATGGGSNARVEVDGQPLGSLTLRVPGEHNARNAAGALAAGLALGYPAGGLLGGLAGYRGVRRRFELRGAAGGVRVYDDYAHHPSEIAAIIATARSIAGGGRVIALFQPHLYSRTRLFAGEFGTALGAADAVVVLDVYGAREDPDPEVTGAMVADAVPTNARPVFVPVFVPGRADAVAAVVSRARAADVIVAMGAGDITDLVPDILAALGVRGAS